MGTFRIVCCQCGSDKVLEKSEKSVVDSSEDDVVYGEGIKRKCIECSNESFIIFKTWIQKDNVR